MLHSSPLGANDVLLERYRSMRRIRSFEERVGELFVRGESAGSVTSAQTPSSVVE